MKYFKQSIPFIVVMSSQLALAEDFKKIHDNIRNRVVEVCSVDEDGTLNVASRCEYNWVDIPVLAKLADPKLKRKPGDVTEIITKISTMRDQNSTFALFDHALVEIIYGMANGKSNIMVYSPSGETLNKYKSGSAWIIDTKHLATEVEEVDGYRVGDKFCLNKPPKGYASGLPVKIKRLFNKEHYAVVDTISDGFLGMGNTFANHYTSFSNLEKCEINDKEKLTLNPTKIINTSSPQVIQDIQINNQQAPKENPPQETLIPAGDDQSGSSVAK